MNENLETMMEKSQNNELTKDGLSTLKYKVLKKELKPLYTWLLVKLPPGPPKPTKSWWVKASESLQKGVDKMTNGVVESAAQSVIESVKTIGSEEAGSKVYWNKTKAYLCSLLSQLLAFQLRHAVCCFWKQVIIRR